MRSSPACNNAAILDPAFGPVPDFDGCGNVLVPDRQVGIPEFAKPRARVAAVEDDGKQHPFRDLLADLGHVIVGERIIPVEIVWANNLVEVVLEFIPIDVTHLGAMPRIMKNERIARFRVGDELQKAGLDRIGRGPLVGQQPYLLVGKPVLLLQRFRDQQDVVYTPFRWLRGSG